MSKFFGELFEKHKECCNWVTVPELQGSSPPTYIWKLLVFNPVHIEGYH
jgi:hypothetical protein